MNIKLLLNSVCVGILAMGTATAFAQPLSYYTGSTPCTPAYVSPCNDPTQANGNPGTRIQYISEVKTTGGLINFINTSNACDNPGSNLKYFPGKLYKNNAGATVAVHITAKSGYSLSLPRYGIWVDWNQDGAYNNLPYPANPNGEYMRTGVLTSLNSPIAAPIFNIPMSAKNGVTRMRVRIGTLINGSASLPEINPCNNTGSLNFGEAEDYDFEVVNPCVMNPVTFKDLSYNSVTATWRSRLNSILYEYFVSDTVYASSTPVNGHDLTTDTTVKFPTANTPITCGKKYYIYTRSICDTAGKGQDYWEYSPWRLDSFSVPPCCFKPPVTITNISSTSANVTWQPVPTVYKYEYAIRIDTLTPQRGTFTTTTGVILYGLDPSKEYYFFLRAYCTPTPTSEWSLDSFLTNFPTGIKPLAPQFGVLAFPNPVKDIVNLQIGAGVRKGTGIVTVTDITGKLVMTAEMEKDVLELNLSGKPAGLYMIRYTDDENTDIIKVSKE